MIHIATVVLLAITIKMAENSKSNELTCAECGDEGVYLTTGRCAFCYWYVEEGKTAWDRPNAGCGCLRKLPQLLSQGITRSFCELYAAEKALKSGTSGCCTTDLCNYPQHSTKYAWNHVEVIKDKIICAEYNPNGIWAKTLNCKMCYWYAEYGHLKYGCLNYLDNYAENYNVCNAWAKSKSKGSGPSGCCNDRDICNHPKNFDYNIGSLYAIEDRAGKRLKNWGK